MPELVLILRDESEKRIIADSGSSVMEAIRNDGVDEMLAICGGCCSCATCQVYVDTEFLGLFPAMSEDEDDLLDSSPFRRPNSRLSCQLVLTDDLDGLKVTMAPEE